MEKEFVTVSTKGEGLALDAVTCIRYSDGAETERLEQEVTEDNFASAIRAMLPFLGTAPLVMFERNDFERLNAFYERDKRIFHVNVLFLDEKFKKVYPDEEVTGFDGIVKFLGVGEKLSDMYAKLSESMTLKFAVLHMGGEKEEVPLTEGRVFAQKVRAEVMKMNTGDEQKAKYIELVDGAGYKRKDRATGKVYNANEGFLDIEDDIMAQIKGEEDNAKYELKEKKRKALGIAGICLIGALAIYLIIITSPTPPK